MPAKYMLSYPKHKLTSVGNVAPKRQSYSCRQTQPYSDTTCAQDMPKNLKPALYGRHQSAASSQRLPFQQMSVTHTWRGQANDMVNCYAHMADKQMT